MTDPIASARLSSGQRIEVHRGEVVLLTGPNGCGKTSLLRALAGLPSARAADDVRVLGQDPQAAPAPELARSVEVALQEPRDTLIGLTVRGEFDLRGRIPAPSLPVALHRDVDSLSSGEARRVSLAVLSGQAPLLLLDEVADGLDDEGRQRLADLVRASQARGAVVLAGHGDALRSLTTRTVELGTVQATALPERPAVGTMPVLRATAAIISRGGNAVDVPGLALPSGMHAVLGRNGAGKSTLLMRLAGLLDAQGVAVQGLPPRPGADVRLLLPQAGDLFTHESVRDELVDCEDLGLVPTTLLDRHPLALSAGEAQRVALTKVLGRPAPVYALDEPERHLDAAGRGRLGAVLARKAGEGACIVVATHDADLAAWCHTRTVVEA